MANAAWKSLEKSHERSSTDSMTLNGTIHKTGFMVTLLCLSGAYAYAAPSMGLFWFGLIGGLVLALVTISNPRMAPILGPMYALAEGLALGTVSSLIDAKYGAVAFQAILATTSILLVTALAYRMLGFHERELSDRFKRGVLIATGGFALFYFLTLMLNVFGIPTAYMHDGDWLAVGICLLAIVVAIANLIMDFDLIRSGIQKSAPKYFEWYSGFALLVTLVWLYLEVLRFIAMTRK